MTCSIIIVNYNTKQITGDCIRSVQKFTEGIEYEIILVDNASTDGSQDYFKNFEGIKFIQSPENVGFGRANNLGANSATGEFVFLLNSDTLLVENSILKMVEFFRENEERLKIGVLGCLLIGKDGKVNGFGNTFPDVDEERQKIIQKIPGGSRFAKFKDEKKYSFEADFFEIDYVIGADMLMKRELFEKMEGFFPGFFMYYEETDLQKRIADIGLKRYIFTKTKIIHLEEASGKVITNYNNRKRIITHKSRVLYLKRNAEKGYGKFRATDFMYLVSNFFNFKYTFRENLEYLKEIAKVY